MRTIITFILIMLLAGCSTSRKLSARTEQTTTEKTIADTHAEQTSHRQEQTAIQTQTQITEAGDMEIVCKEYDTTQSVDTLTGAPPLKKETIIRRRSEKEMLQKQTTASRATSTDSAVIIDNTKHDEITKVDTRSTEKQSRHPPWLLWVLIGAALIGVYKLISR